MAKAFMRDEDLCQRYAQFASDLDRWHFKILYWFMFVLNLVILFIASWTYTKTQETNEEFSHQPQRRSRSLIKYMLVCLVCVLVSAAVVIMEAFALLALQFCDGENLISLYWSTWTMIQVGSLIAMMGIILAMAHSLRNRRHPPWALALGTPVLVIAGLLHLIHDCTKKRVKKIRNGSIMKSSVPSMSEVNTIQGNIEDDLENSVLGEFIGFTVEGGPIVRFNDSIPLNLSQNFAFEVLGYCDGTRPVVAYQKGSIQILPTADKDNQGTQKDARSPQEEKSSDGTQEPRPGAAGVKQIYADADADAPSTPGLSSRIAMGLEKVKHVVLVLSGKGGVGKSSVTTQLALSLTLAGHSVGILDVDLTGPSIPRMLSIEASKVKQVPGGWAPVPVHEADPETGLGSLHAMSLGFLLPQRGDAVVWRGPKKTAMIRQFLKDVLWDDTDYLLIDTPPGTSDEHISLAETLQKDARPGQVAGAVVVTTPQAVATADVRKELNFCVKTGIRVLGVVENMSGFVCPHCSECTDIFGSGGGRSMAEEFKVPFLGSVPIDAQFIALVEEGQRPHYPAGTVVNGRDISSDEKADQSQDKGEGTLVDKYKDCSLFHIFVGIISQLEEKVAGAEVT